jgi:hypothetical protein
MHRGSGPVKNVRLIVSSVAAIAALTGTSVFTLTYVSVMQ